MEKTVNPVLGRPAPIVRLNLRDPRKDKNAKKDEDSLRKAEEYHGREVFILRPADQEEVDEMTTESKEEYERVVKMNPDSTVGYMVARIDNFLHLRVVCEIPAGVDRMLVRGADGKTVPASTYLHHLVMHYFDTDFPTVAQQFRQLQEEDRGG